MMKSYIDNLRHLIESINEEDKNLTRMIKKKMS